LGVGQYEPARQNPCAVEFPGQYAPTAVHAKIVAGVGQYEPAGQAPSTFEPAGQYVPAPVQVVFLVTETQ
jgi:hypothetical protein